MLECPSSSTVPGGHGRHCVALCGRNACVSSAVNVPAVQSSHGVHGFASVSAVPAVQSRHSVGNEPAGAYLPGSHDWHLVDSL